MFTADCMRDSFAVSFNKAVFSITAIFFLRMLGLFLFLPILSPYLYTLNNANSLNVGLALGSYGITQALLQIPMGFLSDKFGRKIIISFGLVLFIIGCLLAATASSIYTMIIARLFQGSGAIAGATIALLADLTNDNNRARAMAFVGMSIGLAFAVAMILGPLLYHFFSMPMIFSLVSLSAILAIIVVIFCVPNVNTVVDRNTSIILKDIKAILLNKNLLCLNFGIFILHFVLSYNFYLVPMMLHKFGNLTNIQQSNLYFWIFLGSICSMLPIVIFGEKKRQLKTIFILSVGLLIIAEIGLFIWGNSLHAIFLITALLLFFTAFNVLEAIIPSLIAKFAPTSMKGTAMGIHSTYQFIGPILGNISAGIMLFYFGFAHSFFLPIILSSFWVGITFYMREPTYLSTFTLSIRNTSMYNEHKIINALKNMPGVFDVVYVASDTKAYLKIDNTIVDKNKLIELYS